MSEPIPWSIKKISIRVLLWLLVISAVTLLLSMTVTFVRVLYLFTACWALFTGGVFLYQPVLTRPWIRYVLLAVVLLLIAWCTTAGKPMNRDRLRETYLTRLRAFTGTRYIWGGETHIGIDCSGLARMALWEAMLSRGIADGNPRLLGATCWRFWWHDVSASGLANEAYGFTRIIGHADQLAGYHNPELQPGDIAVAMQTHVLIYLGSDQWIEANPEDTKVVINTATPSTSRVYFHMPVTLVRWRMLEN